MIFHDKPENRASWDPHGTQCWYVGPAMAHYRCYDLISAEIGEKRVSDTVTWYPSKVGMLVSSSTDLVLAGPVDVAAALRQPHVPSPSPPRNKGDLPR